MMTTLPFQHTTYTVKDGLGSSETFALFQAEDETDYRFLCRIYGWADRWCPIAKEEDIPEAGPVRHCWYNFKYIEKMASDEIADEIEDMDSNDDCKLTGTQGIYARSWMSLLKEEVLRREENSR